MTWLATAVAGVLAFAASKGLQAAALDIRSGWPVVEEFKVIPPPSAARVVYAPIGRQLAADITWARALVYYGSSVIGESDFRYLTKFIDNIIALDPKFKRVYDWAGNAVAWKAERATKEEFQVSVAYLERAILEFPDEWKFYETLALRYALDLVPRTEAQRELDMKRAAELLERAARIPEARIELATMAANLRTKVGDRDRALTELQGMILATDNKQAQEKLLKRYRALLDDPEAADELDAFREAFDRQWKATLPYAPADYFVLLGEPPTPRVDLGAVAPTRDLIIIDLLTQPDDAEPDDQVEDRPDVRR